MGSNWQRLLMAAFLSGCGFCFTYIWYVSTEKKITANDEAPLAQVGKVGNEVRRRPSTRLLWHEVTTGDSLYNGETIRTADGGEVRIQFEDGKFIDLESESMIVLKRSQGEIALDLMTGSLFVNAQIDNNKDLADPTKTIGLVLNSAQGKVDLSGSSATLAKGKGNTVDVQVLEGTAKIQNKDGKSQDLIKGSSGAIGESATNFNQQNLKILSPSLEKPTFIDPDQDSKIAFQWKGFPPSSKVTLWTGERRKDLKEKSTTENADKITLKMPLGKHYWKLVAMDSSSFKVVAESPVYKLDVIGRFPPTVMFPTADAKLILENQNYDMNFKWQKGDEAQYVALEVATDANMKNKLVAKTFSEENEFVLAALTEREYFWRMSAYYKDTEKPVIGKIQKFSIQKPVREIPKEPAKISWVTPLTTTTQYFLTEPTMQLAWKADSRQNEIKEWRLQAQETEAGEESLQKFTLTESQIKTKLAKAGAYLVFAEAIDKDGKVIGQSPTRTLTVQNIPILNSPQILPLNSDLKALDDGRSDIQWESIVGAKEYLLIVKNEAGKEMARKKYSQPQTSLKNLMPGKYFLQVLAVDQYGRMSNVLPAKTLLVSDKSNVRAPSNFRVKVKDK